MINNNGYIINEQLLNETQCQHKLKKQLFNKYCETCKKNICNWCKGHNNHQTIELDSIEPNEEKFEEIENSIKQMKSIKKEIDEKYSKLDNFFEKISNLINDAY